MAFNSIKKGFGKIFGNEGESEYIELDLGQESEKRKVLLRPFILRKFEDVNEILNTLREGYTIAVVDINPLKQRDMIELKRAIAKLKKTAEALEGEVAGFGENMVIITPSFAEIYKPKKLPEPKKEPGYY